MAECFLSEREDTFTVPSSVRERMIPVYTSVLVVLYRGFQLQMPCSQGFTGIDSSMGIVLGLP